MNAGRGVTGRAEAAGDLASTAQSTRAVGRAEPSALRAIGYAGLVAGALDIAYVILYYAVTTDNVTATMVLQGVAAGLIGRDAARGGGTATAALGLGLHFIIALGAAATFYAASRKLRGLVTHAWLSGVLFGIAVWVFMKLVVLPLSATPPRAFFGPGWLVVLIAHVTCVGPPIALIVRRYSPRP